MIAYIALTLFFGVVVTVHVSMNARIGTIVGSPVLANAVFWSVGFASSVAVVLVRGGAKLPWDGLGKVPPVLFAAGIAGSALALFNNWIIPKVGITAFSLLLILGQLATSSLLSRYGLLGVPVEAPSIAKLGGLALAAAGAAVFLLAK